MPKSFVNSMWISLAVLVWMLDNPVCGIKMYSLAAEIDHGGIHPHTYVQVQRHGHDLMDESLWGNHKH